MISVIFTILKIIGLLLLVLLGLILLSVLAVLLVPVRYQAEAAMAEKKPQVKARISWLLRLVCVRVYFVEGNLRYLVKIFGFTLLDSDKPKPEKKPKPPKTKKAKKRKKKAAGSTETLKQKEFEPKTQGTKTPEPKTQGTKKPEPKSVKVETAKPVKEKETFQEKRANLDTKKDGVLQKIQGIKEKIDELLHYLQSPGGKSLLVFLKKKLFRLLRHLKPGALRVHARIGLSNPATTGMILGIAYMLYPIYKENIQLVGEFEEEVIEGDVYLKGRIRLGTLLLIALQILLNKEVRMWIKKATGGNRK